MAPTTSSAREPRISRATLAFLKGLEQHNQRAWFEARRAQYEHDVRDASVSFVRGFAPHLAKVSPHFVADARPLGGSIMRIHRDVRFSKDKSPYRTSIGIHFLHARASETRPAPGWYVHIAPRETFAGGGLWHPPTSTVGKVRKAIDHDPDGWRRATRGVQVEGEQLKRVPKPFADDHALAADLRRKEWLWSVRIKDAQVAGPRFPEAVFDAFQEGAPLMAFLTGAVGHDF
ncbi:MAG TPA: TIGR02453 family protein [Candidatus Thermoplasmatota archaeon]|jgi:uncharacterized protein (TIGR02453 family)|nr:TIGR02453 family protein [Candidatus Thermoplasmatota archaeon]